MKPGVFVDLDLSVAWTESLFRLYFYVLGASAASAGESAMDAGFGACFAGDGPK
jgi:hypothetical protein